MSTIFETVPEYENFKQLDDAKKELWEQKSQYQHKDEYTPEEFYDRAGIWAEFGKIICISVGYFLFKGTSRSFRVTILHGEESNLLKDFRNLLESHFNEAKYLLCAHNGKEFDFPIIARRMVIHSINLPNKLDLFGKKHGKYLIWILPWSYGNLKITSTTLL